MDVAELLSTYGDKYVRAIGVTYSMTALSFAIAMAIAIGVTVMRVSPVRPLRAAGDFYVQVFRNIPGVSLLMIVAYALPNLGFVWSWRTCVTVTVIILASSFGSENFMSGINTIGVGQIEAARSIGLTFGQTMSKVVIPQALRSAVLPMTNLLIATMLTTSLGSLVPLNPQELTGIVSYINTRSVGGILPFTISAACYVGTAVVVGIVGNHVEKRVRILR